MGFWQSGVHIREESTMKIALSTDKCARVHDVRTDRPTRTACGRPAAGQMVADAVPTDCGVCRRVRTANTKRDGRMELHDGSIVGAVATFPTIGDGGRRP
jgi:hypothetical protein